MTKTYAIYKGYQLLAEGTAKECAETLGVRQKTIYWYGTPSYQNRGTGKNSKYLVELEEDRDED